MSRQFEVTIIVDGTDDATAEQAKFAMLDLMARASRRTPDVRFDWRRAVVVADLLYVSDGRAA